MLTLPHAVSHDTLVKPPLNGDGNFVSFNMEKGSQF